MVQSPSWEANWFAASQEIPRISRNPKVHYRTHKRPPPCIKQIILLQAREYKIYKIYLKKGMLSKLTQLELFSAYFNTPHCHPHGTTRMLSRRQKTRLFINTG